MSDRATIAYLRSRRIDPDTLIVGDERTLLESAEIDSRAGWLIIPWLNRQGYLIYETRRSIDPSSSSPKYLNQGDSRPPLYAATQRAWESPEVALVEGQFDALHCEQAQIPTFALTGGSLHDDGAKFLAANLRTKTPRLKRRITIIPDNDPAGEKMLTNVVKKLEGTGVALYIARVPAGYNDLAEYAAAQVQPTAAVRRVWSSRESAFPTLDKALQRVEEFIRRFVYHSDDSVFTAITLWVAHTWIFDDEAGWPAITPYLAITSPEKGSGKSTLLFVISSLSQEPRVVANASAAFLYRVISRQRPTLFYDEGDLLFRKGRDTSDHQMIYNAGFQRGLRVGRMGGANNDEPQEFDTFCAKALALNLRENVELPDTVADRSIPIRMLKKTAGERTEKWSQGDVSLKEKGAELARALRSALQVEKESIMAAGPAMPPLLGSREQDKWHPLLALADVAGGKWPAAARAAAMKLHADQGGAETLGVRLLSDIWDAFEQSSRGPDMIASVELLERLASREDDAPWGRKWGRDLEPSAGDSGKRRAGQKLASQLKPWEIKAHTVRPAGEKGTFRGYVRSDFEDAWRRYLAPIREDVHDKLGE